MIWVLVGWHYGLSSLLTVLALTALEVTLSADNAVINSRVLITMSPFWQKLFLTVGIFTAVFVVRFALPILIVMLTSGLGFGEVYNLIVYDPVGYAEHLHESEVLINSFGGTFLLMVALCFFLDKNKEHHWFTPLERPLASLGRVENITAFVILVIIAIVFFTLDSSHRTDNLMAGIIAVILHEGLQLLGNTMESHQESLTGVQHKTGLVALSAFIYLEVLDSSFSLDGVIGAFAMTTDVIVIMAGLGAGALWVRGITIHLVQKDILARFRFLEHGAHWAIAFLGFVMLSKLYGVELPEWMIGGTGLLMIVLSVWWSIRTKPDKHAELPE